MIGDHQEPNQTDTHTYYCHKRQNGLFAIDRKTYFIQLRHGTHRRDRWSSETNGKRND